MEVYVHGTLGLIVFIGIFVVTMHDTRGVAGGHSSLCVRKMLVYIAAKNHRAHHQQDDNNGLHGPALQGMDGCLSRTDVTYNNKIIVLSHAQ